MRLSSYVIVFIVVFGLFYSCRKPAKFVLTKDQRARIEENILKEPPKPKFALDANFGDNIILIGADIKPEKIKPGDTVEVTYYWKCLKETPGEWKVFVHLELPGGKRMNLDHNPVGELYPISQWKKDEIIKDVQRFTIDSDVRSGMAILWGGIFNEEIYREQGGGDRMKLINKDKVPNDGDNRVRILQFMIEGEEKETSSPSKILKVAKVVLPVTVDGKIDEKEWANADMVTLLTADGKKVDTDPTTVKTLWDDKGLYFAFHCPDNMIESSYKNRDDELWNNDVVEIYLDGGSDGKDYLEVQVSPANIVFDALFKVRRTPDWKEARKHNIEGLQTAVSVVGTLNNPKDSDTYYDVEVFVPFNAIPGLAKIPPDSDTKITCNFFRMDAKEGKVVLAYAFSPTGGDFHDLSKGAFVQLMPSLKEMTEKAVPNLPKTSLAPPRIIPPHALRTQIKPPTNK